MTNFAPIVKGEKMTEYINKAEILEETICKGILCSECSFNDDVKGARCKLIRYINELPTIDIVHCRECKHWKDSDGVYRRGFCAESKCRVNCEKVMRGDWFCADGERK